MSASRLEAIAITTEASIVAQCTEVRLLTQFVRRPGSYRGNGCIHGQDPVHLEGSCLLGSYSS